MRYIMDACYDFVTKKLRIMNWHGTRHSIRFMKKYFQGRSLVAAEIGVLRGANTINILRHLNIRKLYLIDPYLMYDGIDGGQKTTFEKTFELVKHNLRKYLDKIVFVKKKYSTSTCLS